MRVPRYIFGLIVAAGLFGQSATGLEFDVTVIKPTPAGTQGSRQSMGPDGGFTMINMPVRELITFAYNIREFQLSGEPGWVGIDRYDVTSKIDTAGVREPLDPRTMTDQQRQTRADQMRERVRSLLADRFKLVVHRETKEAPVYALRVAKSGPKLEEAKEIGGRQGLSTQRGRVQGFAAPMGMLATMLSMNVGRLVIDKTGLMQKYNFVLTFVPEVGTNGTMGLKGPSEVIEPATDPSGATLFTALQEQLGLRLESERAPVDTIVIDHIEKPSEN